MDIHAPDKPLHTFKDFAIHIAVVTIGILIALGLEGLREVVHDRALVRETRENFTVELGYDRVHAHLELARDEEVLTQLNQLIKDLPELERTDPNQISARLGRFANSGYFFATDTWQTALSTGALAHFSTDELTRYSGVFYSTRTYSDIQREGRPYEDNAKAFFAARHTFSPAELNEGTERLLLFQHAQGGLVQVCKEMIADYARVLPAEKP